MNISDLIAPERVACQVSVASKKRALEAVSALIGQEHEGAPSADVFSSLINRERLGSTGIGHGVAIPHGRVKGLKRPLGAFITLSGGGADFDAIDGEQVDLLFALVIPDAASSEEHLKTLAGLAALFNDPDLRERLRKADTDEEVYQLLTHLEPARAFA